MWVFSLRVSFRRLLSVFMTQNAGFPVSEWTLESQRVRGIDSDAMWRHASDRPDLKLTFGDYYTTELFV